MRKYFPPSGHISDDQVVQDTCWKNVLRKEHSIRSEKKVKHIAIPSLPEHLGFSAERQAYRSRSQQDGKNQGVFAPSRLEESALEGCELLGAQVRHGDPPRRGSESQGRAPSMTTG